MELNLAGKRALVTGSSSGIGEGIAMTLAAENVEVIVHGRDAFRADLVCEKIKNLGGAACTVCGDLSHEEGIRSVLEQVGNIDILVNNAGGPPYYEGDTSATKLWLDIDMSWWKRAYDVNVMSIVGLTNALVPYMRSRRWGRVINVSSAVGYQPAALGADYGAVKAAVLNLTVSLSKLVGKDGVTVNGVVPGPIMTPQLVRFYKELASERSLDHLPLDEIVHELTAEIFELSLSKPGTPDDVGALVAFLASDKSSFITGTNIRVDGGLIQSI